VQVAEQRLIEEEIAKQKEERETQKESRRLVERIEEIIFHHPK
jgi:hypothetical protein